MLKTLSLALLLSAVPMSAANAVLISAAVDVSVYTNSGGANSSYPNTGFAGSSGGGEVAREYLKFLLPTLTAGTQVQSAFLRLRADSSFNNAALPLGVFASTDNFTSTANWTSQPGLGAQLGMFNPTVGVVYSIDVTSFVNSQYLGDGIASLALAGITENFTGSHPSSWRYFSTAFTRLDVTIGTPQAQVPEPAMLGLFGMGAIGLGLARRRKAA